MLGYGVNDADAAVSWVTVTQTLSLDEGDPVGLLEAKATDIDPGFPHDFLESGFVRDLMYSGQWDNIDEHRTH